MTEFQSGDLGWRIGRLEDWRREIEALKPEVQAEVLRRVEKKIDTLTKVIISLALSVLAGMGALVAALLMQISHP